MRLRRVAGLMLRRHAEQQVPIATGVRAPTYRIGVFSRRSRCVLFFARQGVSLRDLHSSLLGHVAYHSTMGARPVAGKAG